MKFARWVFNIAAVYGVISVAPLYFMERTINQQNPPPITHPMFFYGFVGVTLAWQLLFCDCQATDAAAPSHSFRRA